MWRLRVIIMLFGAETCASITSSGAVARRPENSGNRAYGG